MLGECDFQSDSNLPSPPSLFLTPLFVYSVRRRSDISESRFLRSLKMQVNETRIGVLYIFLVCGTNTELSRKNLQPRAEQMIKRTHLQEIESV